MEETMRVIRIVGGTSVDGPGLRTSIYFAGCKHHCPGCHNPESWDPYGGEPMTMSEILSHVEDEGFNVTFTGGDPIYQIDNLVPLAKLIYEAGYTIWLYTGYTFEQLQDMPVFNELKPYLEAVVDGRFDESLRDVGLQFRGSSNQRIIYLGKNRKKTYEELSLL